MARSRSRSRDRPAPQQLGDLELANFINPTGLRAIGKNMFMETDASGSPTTGRPGQNGMGTVIQGFLEMSNVNVMQEMINMIIGQRAYEANTKAIQAADEMLADDKQPEEDKHECPENIFCPP